MKDAMIDMMVSMMPYMKPLMWTGAGFAILAIALIAINFLLKKESNKIIRWSGHIVLVVSVFFILAQIAGYFLSMPPTINFGDASKFEFVLVSFWQIGVALLVAALLIKFSPKLSK